MRRTVIYPYKMGSKSSRALAQELNAIRVYPNKRYKQRPDDVVINWGNTSIPAWENGRIINHPLKVQVAVNKLSALTQLKACGVNTPDFTTDYRKAMEWAEWGYKVYARKLLRGHSGNGIEVFTGRNETIPRAGLYTRGIATQSEYRVHIAFGNVIDYTKKRRVSDREYTEPEMQVRSHNNGWVFCRNNLRRLERVESIAKKAVQALGLDFGAVDIVMDDTGEVYVLEVNTACGLEGTTLQNYKQAFNNL